MKKLLSLLVGVIFCGWLQMPNARLRGTITDETGEPIVDANIYIDSLHLGTVSDLMGEYKLKNVPLGHHEVSYSRIGYLSKKQVIVIDKPMDYVLNVNLKSQGY